MTQFDSNDYWARVHAATSEDLAAVCYPALPLSFNAFVDGIYRRAIESALADISPGTAFEIGCGRGRWIRRLRAAGWKAFGADISFAARPQTAATAERLPVASGACSLVLAITVLQHLSDERKIAALSEASRILSSGGTFLLLEILDRDGVAWQSHVMPKRAAWWREKLTAAGFTIEREIPVEHIPILQLIERMRSGRSEPAAPTHQVSAGSSFIKSAAWRLITVASIAIEPIARTLFPDSASHRLFVAVKRG